MRVKIIWEKLECDLFVTNSIKQDKALTSNGSFAFSKFEGGLKGWLLRANATET